MVLSSLTFLKHEMNSLVFNVTGISDNIRSLMQNKSSQINMFNDEVDMESLFPIKNDSQLKVLEDKIKDISFRQALVCLCNYYSIKIFTRVY